MAQRANKATKSELRQESRLTRPPRLEGKVKEEGMKKIRKPKRRAAAKKHAYKPEGYSERQRKDYQLRSKKH